jgi:hypothetical protein
MIKHRLRLVAFVMVLCTILTSNICVFANEVESNGSYLNYENVASYINEAEKIKVENILDKPVKYYYGDNFTVVEELSGYSLIVEDENGDLYVNGKYIKITYNTSESSKQYRSSDDWTHFDTDSVEFSVGGITLAVVLVLLDKKIPELPKSSVEAALIGYIVGQFFPDLYVLTWEREEYFRIEDVWLELVSWKYVNEIYLGPGGNEYKHNPYGWTKYNYA